MSNPKFPPRVRHMNGMAAMLVAAQTLPVAAQAATPAAAADHLSKVVQQAKDAKEAEAALLELVQRLEKAEAQVARARKVIDAFRAQCHRRPADDLGRTMAEPILNTLEAALK